MSTQNPNPIKGYFQYSNLPKSIDAGSLLRVWMFMKLAAPVDSENPVLVQIVGLAKTGWVVTPDSPYATPEDRANGRAVTLATETEFYQQTVEVAPAKVFDKGEHAYMASLKLDAGLFPTYSYTGSTPMAETFQIRYIVRCSLKAANNPVPALEKEITINAPTVDGSYLDPLSVTDMSPSGAFLNLRSARAQWVDRDTVTVFSTLAAPKDRDVASVFFEIMQKFYIPDPMTKGASMVGVERIFATFSTSGCPRTQNLDTILKLQMPNLPPSMEVGPVSVDYSIRAVLLFSGSPPPPVEFVCTTPILVLPPVKLQIDPSFDETDPDPGAKRTTGTLPVVLLKAQVSMNPVQRFLVGGGQSPVPAPAQIVQPPQPSQQQQQPQQSPPPQQQQAPVPAPSGGRRPLPQPDAGQLAAVKPAPVAAPLADPKSDERRRIQELEAELKRLQVKNDAYIKGGNPPATVSPSNNAARRNPSTESITEPKSFQDLRRKTVKAAKAAALASSPASSPATSSPRATKLANVVHQAIANLPERPIQLPALKSSHAAEQAILKANGGVLHPVKEVGNSMTEDDVNRLFGEALDRYRGKLFDYLTENGAPVAGRQREAIRNAELLAFNRAVAGSEFGKKLGPKLEGDMRRVETDISNAFEISAMQGLVDGMREGRRFIKRGIEAHDVLNPEDLAEALDALKLTLKEKAGPQVPLKVWDKAMEKFETDVRKPLEADLASRPAIPVLQSPPSPRLPGAYPAQAPTVSQFTTPYQTPTSAQYNYGATPPQPTGSRSPRPLPQAPAQDPVYSAFPVAPQTHQGYAAQGHPHQPQTVTPPMTPGSSGGFFGSATPPAVSQYASSSYNQPYATLAQPPHHVYGSSPPGFTQPQYGASPPGGLAQPPQQQYGTSPPGGYAQPYPGGYPNASPPQQPQQPYYGGYQNSAPTQQPQQPYSAYANPSSTQPYTGYQNPSPTQPQQPYSYPTSSPPQQAQQLYDHQGTPLPQPPHNFVSHLPVASTLSHGNKSNFFSTASRAPAVPQKDPRVCGYGDCVNPKATGSSYCLGCQRIVRQHGDAGTYRR